MTDTNTNTAHAAALAMRNAAAALARRRPLYDGASGESADEDLAQAIDDLPLPDVDVTGAAAEAERDAALAELSEQVAFAARHLAIISGVLGSPEPIEIDDIAARLHLLIAERNALAARLAEIERAETAEPAEQIDAGDPDDRIATTDQRTRALDLAASLRAMRRAALPHYSATGQQRHAVVMDSIRIGDLTDAADLIEQMVAAQQPKQES